MFEFLAGFMINPALAIGTGAVAGPILIHILSKRRFRRVRWGAMDFLFEAQSRNRRRVRLEQLLLLLLRCLAVFLIALMLMRPFFRPGTISTILGVAPRTERIILLDDSYSMAYRAASGSSATARSSFHQATQSIETIAQWISDETPADSLTLFVTSRLQEPLFALADLDDDGLQRLRERLAALKPSETVARPAEALAAVAELIRRSPREANTAVYVVSDFQREDWIRSDNEAGPAAQSVAAPLKDAAGDDRTVKLILVNVGNPRAENIAVTDVASGQPQIVAGVPARFEIEVSNFSGRRLEQVEMSVSIAEHRLPPIVIPSLQPGQKVREPIELTFPQDGSDYLRIELAGAVLNDDALRLDNSRSLAVEVVPAVQVLVVDGDPSNDPYRDEVYLLGTALRPAGRAASGNDLTIVDEQELNDLALEEFHVVVLANVARLGTTARENLEDFVRAGGGLLVFAGDQIDIDHYNAELYNDGEGLMPVALGEIEEPPPSAEAMTFAGWDTAHPVMRAFGDALADVLRQVQIFAYIRVDESLPENDPPMPDSEFDRLGAAPRPLPRIIARFNNADESLAIVQRAFGRGTCVFIATSVDQEWNDWASNFSYLPLMLELVQFAARRSPTPGQAVVNNPIDCLIDAGRFKPSALLRTPAYPIEPETAIDAVSRKDADSVVTFDQTQKVGMYQFILTTARGERVTRYAAVNPDPRESNLQPASKAELSKALTELPFEFIADPAILADQSVGARLEMWWPLLLAAIVVLLAEHSLAWWFGTRG